MFLKALQRIQEIQEIIRNVDFYQNGTHLYQAKFIHIQNKIGHLRKDIHSIDSEIIKTVKAHRKQVSKLNSLLRLSQQNLYVSSEELKFLKKQKKCLGADRKYSYSFEQNNHFEKARDTLKLERVERKKAAAEQIIKKSKRRIQELEKELQLIRYTERKEKKIDSKEQERIVQRVFEKLKILIQQSNPVIGQDELVEHKNNQFLNFPFNSNQKSYIDSHLEIKMQKGEDSENEQSSMGDSQYISECSELSESEVHMQIDKCSSCKQPNKELDSHDRLQKQDQNHEDLIQMVFPPVQVQKQGWIVWIWKHIFRK